MGVRMVFFIFPVGAVPQKSDSSLGLQRFSSTNQVLSQVSYANVTSEVSEFKKQVGKAFCSSADIVFFCLPNFKRMKRVLHFRRKSIVFPKTNGKFTLQKWAQLLPFKRKGKEMSVFQSTIPFCQVLWNLKLLLSRFLCIPFFLREIT